MTIAVLAALLLSALAGTAVAGPFEDAVSAHERGDYATALRGFRVLAEQDDARAQYNLGHMYYWSEGVPQDYVLAHKWLNLAAAQGDTTGGNVALRDFVSKKMTAAQIAEAQRLAREWMAEHRKT